MNVLQRLGLDRETRELNRMTAFQMERDYMAKMSRPHNPPPPPQASNSLPTPPRRA